MAASFQDGTIAGGACRDNALITYLFDAVYGLGFLSMFFFMCEKLFGFGRKKTTLQEDPETGKKVAVEIKEFWLPTEDQKKSEIMFR